MASCSLTKYTSKCVPVAPSKAAHNSTVNRNTKAKSIAEDKKLSITTDEEIDLAATKDLCLNAENMTFEAEKEFIIKNAESTEETSSQDSSMIPNNQETKEATTPSDEFDLSDISHKPKELSREDIIAAAEAAAYNE